jgi:hypothetical protein
LGVARNSARITALGDGDLRQIQEEQADDNLSSLTIDLALDLDLQLATTVCAIFDSLATKLDVC